MGKYLQILIALLIIILCLAGCNQEAKADKWVGADSYDGAFSNTGYFYLAENVLYYADFATGINVCLCPKVGCQHDNEDICEGWLNDVDGQMFYWNGGLYYLARDGYGVHLCRRNEDGTGLSAIATLCEEYLEDEQKRSIRFANKIITGGYLYYTAEIEIIEVIDGVSRPKTERCLLRQLDLKSGQEKTLVETTDQGIALVAAKDGSVRYQLSEMIGEVDTNDYEALDNAYKNAKTWLIQLDTDTGTETFLFEKTRYDFYSLEVYFEDKLIYLTHEQSNSFTGKYRIYDIVTGKDTFFYEGEINNLIAGRYSLSHPQEDRNQYTLLDLQTGKELPFCGFYENGTHIRLVSASDKAVILMRNPIPAEGEFRITERAYFYVPIRALADGLQEEDCIDFYVWRNKQGG